MCRLIGAGVTCWFLFLAYNAISATLAAISLITG